MAGMGCNFYYNGTWIHTANVIGIGDSIDSTVFLHHSQSLNLPEGYIFDGWYTTETFDEGTKVVGDYTITGPVHFYAKVIAPVTVASTLTSLADEIRELSGVTEPLGLAEMATNVNEANDEVADQTDLIAQIAALLEGKSVPGGSGSVETCTVVFSNVVGYTEPDDVVAYTDGNGQMQVEAIDGGMSITALKNSLIVVPYSYYDATGITLVRTMFGCAICKVTG